MIRSAHSEEEVMRFRPGGESDDALNCFRRVLVAARQTSHYRPFLADIDVSAVHSIERVLGRLPVIRLETFQNGAARRGRRPRLLYPLGQAGQGPRTAVLDVEVVETSSVRFFRSGWGQRLERWRPEAVAAPVGILRKMHLPPLRNAVIAFTGLLHGELTESDRRMFWDVFQVPVFEQFLGLDGHALAAECEAHEGLHIRPEHAVFEVPGNQLVVTSLTDVTHPVLRAATGFSGWVDTAPCHCGAVTPRLRDVRALAAAQHAA